MDSIIKQTYANLEIILIDDGSPDKSGEICDEYAKKDARVKVIHQKNAGLSAARNAGLDICTGDYIAFVDSDDYIMPEIYEKMLSSLIEYQVDICVCQWQYECSDGCCVIDYNKINRDIFGIKTSKQFAEFFYRGQYENGVVCAVWNKLYKRRIFSNVTFKGRYAEDDRIHNYILSKDYSVMVIPDLLYVYTQNSDSLTNRPFRNDVLIYLDVLKERIKCFEDNEFIATSTRKLYCNMYIEYFFKAKRAGVQMTGIREFDHIFKDAVMKDKVSFKFIVRMCIFRITPKLYEKVCKI